MKSALIATTALVLTLYVIGQTQSSVPTDVRGRCAIGTKYDAKGNCIVHPTAEDKKAFGFIKDKERQAFWAKEELRRRQLEKDSKVIGKNK